MAEPTLRGSVSVCILGRHPLQSKRKPPVSDESGLCGFRRYHGRYKGHPGCVDWRAREQQILAECVERPQKQGSFGRVSVLCGWSEGLYSVSGMRNGIHAARAYRPSSRNTGGHARLSWACPVRALPLIPSCLFDDCLSAFTQLFLENPRRR